MMVIVLVVLLATAVGVMPVVWALGARRANVGRQLAEANAEGHRVRVDEIKAAVNDQKGEIARLSAAVDALQSSCRDDLIGEWALINDLNGDGYQGLVVAWDDKMVRLESVGGRSAMFTDGATKHAEQIDHVSIPAGQVKFSTGVS